MLVNGHSIWQPSYTAICIQKYNHVCPHINPPRKVLTLFVQYCRIAIWRKLHSITRKLNCYHHSFTWYGHASSYNITSTKQLMYVISYRVARSGRIATSLVKLLTHCWCSIFCKYVIFKQYVVPQITHNIPMMHRRTQTSFAWIRPCRVSVSNASQLFNSSWHDTIFVVSP